MLPSHSLLECYSSNKEWLIYLVEERGQWDMRLVTENGRPFYTLASQFLLLVNHAHTDVIFTVFLGRSKVIKCRGKFRKFPLKLHIVFSLFTCSVVSDSLQSLGLWPTRLLCPWDCPGKDTGVGCHFFLQGNLPDLGIELRSPALQADALPSDPQVNHSKWKRFGYYIFNHFFL